MTTAEAQKLSSSGSSGVLKAATVMGAATFISRILGLVREQVFAVLFGAGNATDAFNVAFRIPNLLRDLFAEGAMSASLVPTFTRTLAEDGERRAWRVAGLVFRVLFVSVSILALIGIFFAPQLVGIYASAFKDVPGKFELTVRMTQIMFPFFPLVALAAAVMGILNARGRFFIPALSSALFNVGSIVVGTASALLLFKYGARFGIQPIEGMALGVLVGGLVQVLSQFPSLYRSGYRWPVKEPSDPAWHRDPRLRAMLWMMVPGTIGLAATQINILVNTVLATSQGPGAVSWLNYAFRLMQFPIGVFGVSLAAATLPRVSHLFVSGDIAGVRNTLNSSLRQVIAVNIPASAGLAFLGFPIIELLFQYGRFYPQDTQATAIALAMYAVGLTAYSAVKVLVPACYALGNTRIPVISSIVAVFATIGLNLLMIRPFGYWGLALGTSLAAILNSAFLLRAIRMILRQHGSDLEYAPLLRTLSGQVLVALVMGSACWVTHLGFRHYVPDVLFVEIFGVSALPIIRSIKVFALVIEGIFLTLVLARIFRLRDTTDAYDFFAIKIKKKLQSRS
ncbi:MAG: murein biosynthesis integral membrane protein MurJ [Bdellovibrionales bacterium GWB1_55_8]|nr:MAG: murein biosynthesis integral membrane protein MurJ [Bdellovibrionales bacterium GWB1_55_8]